MMGRKAKELSALEVGRLKAPGLHFVGGVAGLALKIGDTGGKSWILRAMVGGKRRDMGLGGFPDVLLAGAREAARTAKDAIRNGQDPIETRQASKRELKASQARNKTFKECALAYMEVHEAGWKNAKHRAQWASTLETYAYPVIGALPVRDVGQAQILEVLEPIWRTRTETASRLRGRIESVLDWATVRHYREGLNPARWKGHLDALLPAPGKVAKSGHFSAMPYQQIPAFMQTLKAAEGMGPRAMEFLILTACRSGEVRGARWEEFDLEAAIWTIPAARMKAGKEHRVPLSAAVLDLLAGLPRIAGEDTVFFGRNGGSLSDMTLTAFMRREGFEFTAHGFRSSFRDWAGETTNYPREVCEHALAHQLKDKVEAAYQRGDLLTKRRAMMADWAAYVGKKPEAGNVVQLMAGAA